MKLKSIKKIDLCGVYNLICVDKETNKKLLFCIRYEHFVYNVMSFDFTNVPNVFKYLINNIFCEVFDDFAICYLDNILSYFKTLKEHEKYVCLNL